MNAQRELEGVTGSGVENVEVVRDDAAVSSPFVFNLPGNFRPSR